MIVFHYIFFIHQRIPWLQCPIGSMLRTTTVLVNTQEVDCDTSHKSGNFITLMALHRTRNTLIDTLVKLLSWAYLERQWILDFKVYNWFTERKGNCKLEQTIYNFIFCQILFLWLINVYMWPTNAESFENFHDLVIVIF